MSETWDTLAADYDAWYEAPMGAFVLDVEITTLLSLTSGLVERRGLEVGCGTGQFGRTFAGQGAWMVGVDRSTTMLEITLGKSNGRLYLCRAEGERLPFAVHSFDVVLAVTVLEFVSDPEAVLTETWRVLQPGGQLIVGVLNAWSLWALARRLRGDDSPYVQAHFFNLPELLRLLRTFALPRWQGAVFLPPWVRGERQSWWSCLENAGARWWPIFGAFLAAAVQKPMEVKR